MMMECYKTSKDYKRLKELLDRGCRVIVICDEDYLGFGIKEEDTGDYYFGGRIGITYFNPEKFEENCAQDRLAFIEPDDMSELPMWKWVDPKYEYPPCITREMDENGDWRYSLSSGRLYEMCQYISLAELSLKLQDEPVEKPVDVEAAMKNLEEKIKLASKTWKGVDVDKYMDEMRGRCPIESDDLEEEVKRWIYDAVYDLDGPALMGTSEYLSVEDVANIARHFAEWGAEHLKK